MPVSKKDVAYRQRRAFFVRVAVFCASGVYNLTSRRAMRSVCWLAALALAVLTLMCSFPPFALARDSQCALAPPQAAGCKQLRPCLTARPPSFAACCLLRSRLARFVLLLMYAPALVLWLPASCVGTTAPVRRLLRRLLLEWRCGRLSFLGLFRPPLLASVGFSVGLRRGDAPRHPPTVSACLSAVGYGFPFLLVYSDNSQPTKITIMYKNQLIKIHNFS